MRERGMLKRRRSSSSQARVCMSKRRVREALVTSVRCWVQAVSFQMSQESTVPKASSPRLARSRAPGTFSRSQAIF